MNKEQERLNELDARGIELIDNDTFLCGGIQCDQTVTMGSSASQLWLETLNIAL